MYSNGHVVAVQVNGKTVNDSNGKVLLPFGVEYSLMLKNRNDRKAVVRVYIDGDEVTKTGKLILEANSSLNLERYIDDMDKGAKFKFVPLGHKDVDDKGNSEKGWVEVRFQLVKPPQMPVIIHEDHIYHEHHHHNYWDYPHWKYPYYTNNPIWYSANSGDCVGTLNNGGMNLTTVNCNSNVTFSSNFSQESGATIKGNNSNQKFSYSYVGELESQETVIRFQLVGTSDKDVASQYTKTHCNQCGKRYEKNDIFCSKCGTKK